MSRAKLKKKIKRIAPKRAALRKKKKTSKKKILKIAFKKTRSTKKTKKAAGKRRRAVKVRRHNKHKAVKTADIEVTIDDILAATPLPEETTPAAEIIETSAKVAPTTPFYYELLADRISFEATGALPKAADETVVSAEAAPHRLSLSPNAASQHLVDLRELALLRPHGNKLRRQKTRRPAFANISVPRTISERPGRDVGPEGTLLVGTGKFIYTLTKTVALGAGHLAAYPVKLGLNLADKLDLDRVEPIEKESKPVFEKTTKTLPAPKISFLKHEEIPAAPARPAPPKKTVAAKPFDLKRSLLSFAGASLAVLLPIFGVDTYRSLSSIKDQAENAREIGSAAIHGEASFGDVQLALSEAQNSVDDLGRVANALLERLPGLGDQYRSGKNLIAAGEDLANAADLLKSGLGVLNDLDLEVTAKIAKAEELAARAAPLISQADQALKDTGDLPEIANVPELSSLKTTVASIDNMVGEFLGLAPALRRILGEDQTRRYLVVFQNNAELRPAGGFLGSFALIDVDRGRIKNIEVPAGGPYDLQGSLRASVLSPLPLRLVRAKWEFQDANWFPDFPTTAKKLIWFYNESVGASVDGVIAINAPVLADLLDAVGPVGMPEYGVVATGADVLKTAQEIVESPEARASGKPKQFIADLLPLVLDRIMSGDEKTTLRTLSLFSSALDDKDIQMYFTDPDTEKTFDDRDWTGRLARLPENFDSLALNRANIAGGKTDAVMQTRIEHEATVDTDGKITDRTTVTLTHRGVKGERFTGVRNVTYLRLYVPEGSALVSAAGDIRAPGYALFEEPTEGLAPDETLAAVSGPTWRDPNSGAAINNEFGRTVFGVWTQTDPGASSSVTFTYTLPFTLNPAAVPQTLAEKIGLAPADKPSAPYGLLIEKQSGAEETEIQSTLKLPEGWYPSFAAPEGIASENGWSFTANLTRNRAIGAIITK